MKEDYAKIVHYLIQNFHKVKQYNFPITMFEIEETKNIIIQNHTIMLG